MKPTSAGKVQRLHGAPHGMLSEQCMREGNELCKLTEKSSRITATKFGKHCCKDVHTLSINNFQILKKSFQLDSNLLAVQVR